MIRSYDWSATSLGTPDQWPQTLRTALGLVLSSRFPMFIWWGPEMIQFYNDAYRPSLGFSGKHPTAVGQRGEECWPEIWPVIKPIIDEVWAGNSNWSEDQLIPIYRNNMLEDVYWTFSYSPLKEDDGTVSGILVICQETTEKVKAKLQLEEADKKFRHIIRQAPAGIAVLKGADHIVETVNDKYIRLLCTTEEALVNQPLFDALPAMRETVEPLLTSVLKTGNPCYGPEFETPDGIFNFFYQPLLDADDRIEGVIVVSNDLTTEVKARRELRYTEALRNANHNLQRSNTELEQFAFVASHDMQEPLRKIRMFTAMLEKSLGEISEPSHKYLDKIGNAAGRMRKLIDDMLYYSRLTRPETTFRKVDLNELVSQVVNDFELLIQEKNAVIRCDTLPSIDANPLQISQLFSNLLSNSLKFNDGARPEIRIKATPVDAVQIPRLEGLHQQLSYYQLEFSDNGIGFDQQYAEQIFNIFQRLHSRQEYSGTGIGLALCKKIALHHQGNIFAHATEGQGATFHVYLPVRQPSLH
ncbi:PAS domain-containing sensor histidine kinase [Chitinophaga cymbidii]|uniref:histidine kinase n=1 Tax=Chitinophaga cymbidii TaxID=1096750 RepID=A0A512RJC2_9BACT|nr:ATP-binding protein [Chitinophaga cymbidii]GEP95788.1 hypothetical protein CCY01nite_20480 [Chitinophaga cymbidii]